METLIFDTSVIFNFGHRGQLDFLLKKLATQARLLTTPIVESECGKGEYKTFYAEFLKVHFEICSTQSAAAIPAEEFSRLSGILDAGELSVLLATAEYSATAVIDEKLARTECTKLGFKLMGTLGLIERCRSQSWVSDEECLDIVVRLRAGKFSIPKPGANHTFVEYLRETM